MRSTHGRHTKVMRDTRSGDPYHRHMFTPDAPQATRTLTLVLPESEWRALREAEPDSVAWLQARIRERLSGAATIAPPNTPDTWSDDY